MATSTPTLAQEPIPTNSRNDGNSGLDLRFRDLTNMHKKPLSIPSLTQHTHTFILLHGRGDDATAFGPEFLRSRPSSAKSLRELFPGMKFIFPTARRRPMGIMSSCVINQWFDIMSLADPAMQEDLQIEGLRESSAFVHALAEKEMESIPCGNIILGGLSQGCATGLHALLTFEPKGSEGGEKKSSLGAFVGMSGWMPCRPTIDEIVKKPVAYGIDNANEGAPFARDQGADETGRSAELQALNFLRDSMSLPPLATASPACFQTPVFLGHGSADDTVAVQLGDEASATLRALGLDVTWKTYKDFGHWYKDPEEIDDIVDFLREKVGSLESKSGEREH